MDFERSVEIAIFINNTSQEVHNVHLQPLCDYSAVYVYKKKQYKYKQLQ